MKTVPEYSIVNLLDRTWICIILLFALQVSYFFSCLKAEDDLPQRVGYINEYGGLMSGSEQIKIEENLASIEKRWGIETVILVTLRDPYKNPDYLAGKIMDEWRLTDKKSLLLLFVKEAKSWFWERRFGSRLSDLVNLDYLDSHLKKIDPYVERKEISVAINQAVEMLPKVVTTSPEVGETNQKGFNKSIIIYPLAGLLGAVILSLLIKRLSNRICFRCFRLLKVRHSTPFGREASRGEKHIIYYCPHCGYTKVKKVSR